MLSGRAVCSCLDDYFGDPQVGCRPECVINSDCGSNQACQGYRCVDPCKLGSVCGVGAVCKCIDHTATCACPDGHEGDAFVQCYPRREYTATAPQPRRVFCFPVI